MRPTIRQLEYVVAVAEERSFSKAAQRCFVSQPSLSSQVRQLEVRLGVELFERTSRGVLVTNVGNDVVEIGRRILEESDRLLQSALASHASLAGPLNFGSISTITPYLLPAALHDISEEFPDLELHVHDGPGPALKQGLEAGEIDVLLTPLPTGLSNTEEVHLIQDPFVLATPANSAIADLPEPLDVTALAGCELLLLDDPHCLRGHALELCDRVDAKAKTSFHASSLGTIVQLVRRGIGMTLLPAIAIDVELAGQSEIRLKRLAAPTPGRTLGLAWRRGSHRADEFKILASILMSHAEKCLRWEERLSDGE